MKRHLIIFEEKIEIFLFFVLTGCIFLIIKNCYLILLHHKIPSENIKNVPKKIQS